jgi:cob(I)alamin adenosyltransferase
LIHILTGNGKGKTTSAFGMALRALGNGMSVVIVQLLKGTPTGEVKAIEQLKGIKVIRAERATSFDYANIPNLKAEHNAMLKTALELKSDMLILDEVIGAYNHGYVDKELVIDICHSYKGELVLTGRNAPKELIEEADYVGEIVKLKHPYDNGTVAREGIEY